MCTDNCSMSLIVTGRQIYSSMTLVTHLGVLKPCYTVEKQLGFSESSKDSTQSQVTPIHAPKTDTKSGHSFLHQKMKGTERKLSNNSTKHSIPREQLQGSPLTKQDILETYADIFTRNWEVSRITLQVPT